MSKEAIHSDAAPAAIGTYSQAIKAGNLVFLSGQIPLDPSTMEIVGGDFEARARQVFDNLKAVAEAAGGDLNGVVKLTIYLTDLSNFPTVNEVIARIAGRKTPRIRRGDHSAGSATRPNAAMAEPPNARITAPTP